jgi:2-polyprenyl-6-hydroxyphenyl methylase/3-demethylubiquinone-9 3-methyltransferase
MSLTDRSTHFEFGKNWLSYSDTINQDRIEFAERSLSDALGIEVKGKSFLDVGCGSGLFALAALRLGAAHVHAIDIDENSVAATSRVLERYASSGRWHVERASVLELPATFPKNFDVVYSWGVLHHTGAMWDAVDRAAALVGPGGLLVIALYRKTMLCPAWAVEKRLYANHPTTFALIARAVFKAAWTASQVMKGKNPLARIRTYQSHRGMSWSHDVHDWLGGYPYESASFDDVLAAVATCGFDLVRSNARRGKPIGLLGSGCNEYVFLKR